MVSLSFRTERRLKRTRVAPTPHLIKFLVFFGAELAVLHVAEVILPLEREH